MARVLIVGCGYVGSALGQRLAADDHEVWGLRRRPVSMPPGVQPLAGDISSPRSLKELPADLDFVFYLVSPGGRDDPHYRAAYVDGVKGLRQALAQALRPPRRLFFVSSTGVYAQRKGEWVDETSPAEPDHHSGRRLLEGESLALGGPIPATVLRLAGIYGPRRTRLVDRVRSGSATYAAGAPVWTNRIHRDDAAGALQHLMGLERPEPLYLGVDCEPSPDRAVLEWLAGVLGAPPPRPAPPGELPTRAGRSNKRCRNDRLLASGYVFRFPTFREGYSAVLEECL